MESIACIICAYNEEKTISDVIDKVCSSGIFSQIVIVNDGSEDFTHLEIKRMSKIYSFDYIHLSQNKGKGFAMAKAVEKTYMDTIVFCDADLSGIRRTHFMQLIRPILDNESDMVLGQGAETIVNYKMNPFKSITGQRSVKRIDLINILDDMKTSRFGVETLINLYYQSSMKNVKYVMLEGLKHPTKFSKTSHPRAIMEFIIEGQQIMLTVFKNYKMLTRILANKFTIFTIFIFTKIHTFT